VQFYFSIFLKGFNCFLNFIRFPIARQIFQAIEKPWDQILGTIIIFIIFTYVFTLYVFLNYWDDVKAKEADLICGSLLFCFIYIFDQTFKNNGGFTANLVLTELSSSNYDEVIFDFVYIFIILILISQIIAGIIIDTFAQLREGDKSKQYD
jgi:hypothetical protein